MAKPPDSPPDLRQAARFIVETRARGKRVTESMYEELGLALERDSAAGAQASLASPAEATFRLDVVRALCLFDETRPPPASAELVEAIARNFSACAAVPWLELCKIAGKTIRATGGGGLPAANDWTRLLGELRSNDGPPAEPSTESPPLIPPASALRPGYAAAVTEGGEVFQMAWSSLCLAWGATLEQVPCAQWEQLLDAARAARGLERDRGRAEASGEPSDVVGLKPADAADMAAACAVAAPGSKSENARPRWPVIRDRLERLAGRRAVDGYEFIFAELERRCTLTPQERGKDTRVSARLVRRAQALAVLVGELQELGAEAPEPFGETARALAAFAQGVVDLCSVEA